MRHYLYLLIFTLLTFVSCETELPEGEWSKEPPIIYQLSINKTTIASKSEGSSETFSITSNDSWTVGSSESWIKVSDTAGTGDKTVTVTVGANASKESRTGTITVNGKNSGSKIIIVSQSGYSLQVDKMTLSAEAEEPNVSFRIVSNDNWIVSTDVNWATMSLTTGSGDKNIIVSLNANTSMESRSGAIVVYGTISDIYISITITQKGINSINGHEFINLGLPSGLLWATCNVGAAKPEDYGDYFAWGATKPQSNYDWVSTPYQTQNTTDNKSTKFTKYLVSATSSYRDSTAKDSDAIKTVLDLEDDAAHISWGGGWRMPTRAELDELLSSNNSTWTWTTVNGVFGLKLTSNNNNNSLFLPAAGFRDGFELKSFGIYGYYWTSSQDTRVFYASEPFDAYYRVFTRNSWEWSSVHRFNGLSIRPVCEFSE